MVARIGIKPRTFCTVPAPFRLLLPVALTAGVLAVAGCGSSDSSGSTPPPVPKPSAKPQDFPTAKGKTLTSLRAGLPAGPILAPTTTSALEVGTNRVGFALRDRANKLISGAAVALYTTNDDGSNVKGPYVAHVESLVVKPQFESKTTSQDPTAAKSIYVASVPIPKAGKRVITGVARLDGRLVATTGFELPIPARDAKGRPPDVGQKAIVIHTLTLADVAGQASKIETRVPPDDDILKTDFADVVGKKPVILSFATPLLCQSRVCGPVVDVVAQVAAQYSGKIAVARQEIYKNNQVSAGYRPQVLAWRIPTEPWTFVVAKDGRISSRFEGAVSVGELQRAVAKVVT